MEELTETEKIIEFLEKHYENEILQLNKDQPSLRIDFRLLERADVDLSEDFLEILKNLLKKSSYVWLDGFLKKRRK